MSGLLQRLAARATGSAWALRSDARLPFAGGTLATAETAANMVPATLAAPPSGTVDGQPMVVARRTEPPAGDVLREPTPIAAHAQPQPAMQGRAATAATQPMPATRATARAVGDPAERPTPGDTTPAAQATSTHPAQVNTAPPRAAHTAMPADPPPLFPDHRSDGNAATRPTAARATAASSTQRAPHALPALRQPTAKAARPADPTEVHVHIGRIEVTAVQAPQAAQRPARERTQPMSLDAYLKQRKEPS